MTIDHFLTWAPLGFSIAAILISFLSYWHSRSTAKGSLFLKAHETALKANQKLDGGEALMDRALRSRARMHPTLSGTKAGALIAFEREFVKDKESLSKLRPAGAPKLSDSPRVLTQSIVRAEQLAARADSILSKYAASLELDQHNRDIMAQTRATMGRGSCDD